MSKIEPIDSVARGKDPYWWLHPAYRGEQSLDMATLDAMPQGIYKWVSYSDEVPVGDEIGSNKDLTDGYFADFAQLLYKMNGFRFGPVENSYVIVCLEPLKRWAVGQLRADPVTPVQVFNNLIFDSESSARAKAEALRS
ncbi:MAG TPA: hypothetical protein DGR97_13740 [Gammaproteobacteria bacterium]|nr:hypothetical protein [Gammaproteobacteria bacterium]|tara:strand:- start:3671 stop:4087 length:417 start_codon:yes stop_codon:yes gene_type:complete